MNSFRKGAREDERIPYGGVRQGGAGKHRGQDGPKTNTIVRDGKQRSSAFDASALECALSLKDDFIGFGMDVRVTVVSMGIPATESLLRDCIARGADDALLLTDRAFAGADTLATTYALKCGIERSTRT